MFRGKAARRRLGLVDLIERRLLAGRTDEQKEAAAELERQLARLLEIKGVCITHERTDKP